ncbi:MAG: bifunctional precorrin-2 dehydrogenase/sirohydrochlorin ferrochelatase [Spirochaetaceae bacterium]
MKKFMPIAIDVYGKKILLVGGGRFAQHKVVLLQRFTNNITIVGSKISQEIKDSGLTYLEEDYNEKHLDGIYIVYACTNDRELNKQIRADGHKKGVIVNVADDPEICDFVSPAMYIEGDMTVAVTSNGTDVYRSIKWRNKLKEFLRGKSRDFK